MNPRTRHALQAIAIILPLLFAPAALADTREQPLKIEKVLAYNKAAPFDLHERTTKEENGVVIQDVDYAGYTEAHGRIKAFIVKPHGKGPFAGIVYFHWLGRPNGDRTQFLDEAVAIAKQGVVSVLIQGYFPWKEPPTDGPTDRQKIIDQTIEARRAIDLLLSQKEVDKKRIAYVGHDYGSMYGGIITAVERRVHAYVLIAGLGKFSPWSLKYWPKTAAKGNEAYEQAVASLDPIAHVSHARGAAFLFQFANADEFITKDEANAFFNQATKPKDIKWYDAEHDLRLEAARNDRRDWLTRQLHLRSTSDG
jgi:cephalosporin-C deacetylase-like acetyl esterase